MEFLEILSQEKDLTLQNYYSESKIGDLRSKISNNNQTFFKDEELYFLSRGDHLFIVTKLNISHYTNFKLIKTFTISDYPEIKTFYIGDVICVGDLLLISWSQKIAYYYDEYVMCYNFKTKVLVVEYDFPYFTGSNKDFKSDKIVITTDYDFNIIDFKEKISIENYSKDFLNIIFF